MSDGLAFSGVFLLMCGVALLCSLAPNHQLLSNEQDWWTTGGKILQVRAPLYSRDPFEPGPIFFQSATIMYSYQVAGKKYVGATVLSPEGPRFYDSFSDFYKSGDCYSENVRDAKLQKTLMENYQRQLQRDPANAFLIPPDGGWRTRRTPMQMAKPFSFLTLSEAHVPRVMYDPKDPQKSSLSDLIREHEVRMGRIAFGFIIAAAMVFILRLALTSAEPQ